MNVAKKPTLVILAAGMGSRFGGLKQIEPIGPNGEVIIDYSIYDCKRAGFGKVVFIIKPENEEDIRNAIGNKVEKHIPVEYVYQELTNLPEGYTVPEGRVKPWGTGHALLCCKDVIKENFAVINADDFYGRSAFELIHGFLTEDKDLEPIEEYCLVTYSLGSTLSDKGSVSRGVIKVDEDGFMTQIVETKEIKKFGKSIAALEQDRIVKTFTPETPVSMQTWGFTPGLFNRLEQGFIEFLNDKNEDPLKGEYFLPIEIDKMINDHRATVKTLPCDSSWFGITYQEDRENAIMSIHDHITEGVYPMNLWD